PGNLSLASGMGMMPNAGLMRANVPPGGMPIGDVTQAQFAASSPIAPLFPAQRTQVFFSSPPSSPGMKVYWFSQAKDGTPSYSPYPLEAPGRYNFAQGAIYRLKLTHIHKDRPGLA